LTGLSAYGLESGPTIAGEEVDLYPDDMYGQAQRVRELLESQQFARPWRSAEREYLSTAGAIREAIGAAYGINPASGSMGVLGRKALPKKKEKLGLTGEQEPLDPLVRLQEELVDRFRNYNVDQQNDRIRDIMNQRSQTLGRLSAERGAAMGTPGLFQGAMSANEASRDTLANQAMAAYKPMQRQLEEQYQEQNQQLLGALQQLEHETQATVRMMGREGVFDRKQT
jgi:hypothetical protein